MARPSKEYFARVMRKIKKENKDKDCWNCKHLLGVYYDGVTFECAEFGDNSMWWYEGDNCKKFNRKPEGMA